MAAMLRGGGRRATRERLQMQIAWHERSSVRQTAWVGFPFVTLTAMAYGDFNPARRFLASWNTI